MGLLAFFRSNARAVLLWLQETDRTPDEASGPGEIANKRESPGRKVASSNLSEGKGTGKQQGKQGSSRCQKDAGRQGDEELQVFPCVIRERGPDEQEQKLPGRQAQSPEREHGLWRPQVGRHSVRFTNR